MIGINDINIDDMDLSGSQVIAISAERLEEGDYMQSMGNDFCGSLTAQKLFSPPKLIFY